MISGGLTSMRNVVLFSILYSQTLLCFASSDIKAATLIPPVIVSKPISFTQTNAAKVVITREQMAELGVTSLTQALQTLGGVQLQDTTGNGSQVLISMRGFGANASSNTLLLINGIPITNPDLAPPDLNSIPFQEIEYVEVISGSESVLYGDQAVGGVINVVTHDKTKNNIVVSCSAGSYNAHNCAAGLNESYKQLNFGIGVLNQHTDNYRDHNDYDQNLLSGRFDYVYTSGTTKVDYTFANERMLYPGALTGEQVSQNRRQSTNDTDFFKDSNASIHLKQDQELTANWHLITDLEHRQMFGSGVLFSPFRQSRVINYLKPQVKGHVGEVLLNGGVDYENDTYNLNTDFGTTDDTEQKYSLFGMATIPLEKRLALLIGARGAQQDNQLQEASELDTINRALATNIGISFQPVENTKLFLRRAGSFRFPKADENASTPPGVNGLKTQRGVAYETGLEWKWHKANTRFSIYQLNLTDEIAFDPLQTPDRPFGTNTNYPPTVRQGFSLSEKYQFTDQIAWDGQYNYVNARFQSGVDSGDRIPLVAENTVHTGINYAFISHWNLYTEAVYTGNEYSANDNANIAGKIGGYTMYNINLRFVYQHLNAAFRINNLFNKYYYLYTTYEPSLDEQFYYPAAGRNLLFTVKYELE
jgi:iron complex outermembrane receptor protein